MSIGSNAFSGCTGLTSVTIGNSVTSISSGAFLDCSSLTSITIPDSVTRIFDNSIGYLLNVDTLSFEKIENLTIYGYKDTAAETYAIENGFRFVDLSGEKVILGDVDGDGEVSATDAKGISQYLAKMDISYFNERAAEVDGDGKISVIDASRIQQYLAKYDIESKIGEQI